MKSFYTETNRNRENKGTAMWLWIVCGVLAVGLGLYRVWHIRYTGSVEGRLYVDGEIGAEGHMVVCQYVKSNLADGSFALPCIKRFTTTNRNGKFRFSGIPAGEIGLGRLRSSRAMLLRQGDLHPDVEQTLRIEAGKTLSISLGESNVCVSGKLLFPDEYLRDGWADKRTFWLERLGRLPHDSLGESTSEAESAESQADRDPTNDGSRCWYHVAVERDGHFEVSGVRPGIYGLRVSDDTWDYLPVDFPVGHCGIGIKIIEVHDNDGNQERIDMGEILVSDSSLGLHGPGNVEGILYRDGEPAPVGTEVSCSVHTEWEDEFDAPRWNTCGVGIIWDETTQTNASGKFLFKNLPVGNAVVSDGHGNSKGTDWEDHDVSDNTGKDLDDIVIQSGQTVWVLLGEPSESHAE